jgi:hypothetical protein
MFGFKSVVAAITVATMVGTSAFAADGALLAGKPAGVKSAQEIGTGALLIGAAAVGIIAAVAIVVTNQSGDRANNATNLGSGNANSTLSTTTTSG